MAKVILFILLIFLLQECIAQSADPPRGLCEPSDTNADCMACFNSLVYHTLSSGDNQYRMQRAFFPPDISSPVFVIVYYYYEGLDEEPQTWFWSESTFYALFNPLAVHQFTSLLFGDPEFRTSRLNLTLSEDCYGADADMMHLLTQRVSCLAITYM